MGNTLKYEVDLEFLRHTLQNLVQINSVNPSLSRDAPGEKEIGTYIHRTLKDLGFPSRLDQIEDGRVNVVSLIEGKKNGRSLMVNAHTDTVGIENMADPFSGTITDGRLYGRGAQDMKGSIAAMLTVLKTLADHDVTLNGDLLVAFVADEEYASMGTERLLKKYRTDGAIVTEPSNLQICLAHKGFGLFEIQTHGKAAHGGRPEKGIDANMHMGMVLSELRQLSREFQSAESHPLLGTPSLHVPVIDGGSEAFTYAAQCRAIVEKRTLPGDSRQAVQGKIESILENIGDREKNFRASQHPLMWRDAFETQQSSDLVTHLAGSVQDVTNKNPTYIGHSWWEDSGLISKKGIDTAIIGPRGEGLHSNEEWVDIQSVADLARILLQTALSYCN